MSSSDVIAIQSQLRILEESQRQRFTGALSRIRAASSSSLSRQTGHTLEGLPVP